MESLKMFIDGQWIDGAEGNSRVLINPVDGSEMERVAEGTVSDVARAARAAKEAVDRNGAWGSCTVYERAVLLNRVADLLEGRVAEIAQVESRNTGRLLKETMSDDLLGAVGCFRSYAQMLTELTGKTAGRMDSLFTVTLQEPLGVCAIIVPWNYPLLTACSFIAPALAAGNSILVKPSSTTPLTAILLFEILEEAGFPKGAAHLILGAGNAIGDAIAENPDVDMVVFTGSTEVGSHLYEKCGSTTKKIIVEMGGKSPVIVYDDVDIDTVVDNVMFSIFLSQGQVCLAGSRLYLQESIYDDFLERLVHRTKKIKMGDPMLAETEMGPVVSQGHMQRVLSMMEAGKEEGAKAVCGGRRATDGALENGFYVEPTIFVDCKQTMSIVQEEIFGPVLTVQKFKTEEEAIQLSNATKYGLAAQIYTGDMAKAMRTADRIEAGMVWINTYLEGNGGCACTPYKQSGVGLIGGVEGLREFTRTKQVNMRFTAVKNSWFAE